MLLLSHASSTADSPLLPILGEKSDFCRKDKTLAHILEALDSLENKIDTISSSSQTGSQSESSRAYDTASEHSSKQLRGDSKRDSQGFAKSRRQSQSAASESHSLSRSGMSTIDSLSSPSNHRIESRTVLAWPAVRSVLQDDLAAIPRWHGSEEGGEKWLQRVSEDFGSPLPPGERSFVFIGGGPAALWNSGTSYVTKNIVEELCRAFFCIYHPPFPILDRQHFYTVTLPQAYMNSFDQYDQASTKVLLVMALGAVAEEGERGNPIYEEPGGRTTGIRGGSPERPPGLIFLNEAKKRIGVSLDRSDLNTLQCFILFA